MIHFIAAFKTISNPCKPHKKFPQKSFQPFEDHNRMNGFFQSDCDIRGQKIAKILINSIQCRGLW